MASTTTWSLRVPAVNIIIFICLASLLHLLLIATSHLLLDEFPLSTPCWSSDRAASPSRVVPDLTSHSTWSWSWWFLMLSPWTLLWEFIWKTKEISFSLIWKTKVSLGSHAKDNEAVYGPVQLPPITRRKLMYGGEKMWQHSEGSPVQS